MFWCVFVFPLILQRCFGFPPSARLLTKGRAESRLGTLGFLGFCWLSHGFPKFFLGFQGLLFLRGVLPTVA